MCKERIHVGPELEKRWVLLVCMRLCVCVPVWVVGGGVEDQHHVVEEHVVERWSMCTVHTIKQRMS
jgi:hypothetical protein